MSCFKAFIFIFSILLIAYITGFNIYNIKRISDIEVKDAKLKNHNDNSEIVNASILVEDKHRCLLRLFGNKSASTQQKIKWNYDGSLQKYQFTIENFPTFSPIDLHHFLNNPEQEKLKSVPVLDSSSAALIGLSVCENELYMVNMTDCRMLKNFFNTNVTFDETQNECFSSFDVVLPPKELNKTFADQKYVSGILCDRFTCYKEFLNPKISFSVIKKCFSKPFDSPSNQAFPILVDFWPLKYRIRVSENILILTVFDTLYERNIAKSIKKRTMQNLNNLNADSKMNANDNQTIDEKQTSLDNKLRSKKQFIDFNLDSILELHKILYTTPLYKFLQLTNHKIYIDALVEYFSKSCEKSLDFWQRKEGLNDSQKLCCKITAQNLAVKQLNILTSSELISNSEIFFDHCLSPIKKKRRLDLHSTRIFRR
ncbi:hypothetical protein EDEG_03108 [Edhazardia aedis USNM 41457]|uniref:Uncharacterized protein n=1 Tax=Edhazardia aedis (strain USNM 41457) TaxID=1003232 RepID=J8ZS11_EDHAE|nr:hypothetical protein EDEG_03108 [Edhazardia aedis USNM 41457]|eukprot:EJW02488.1 hypothetical protein EDEG_03108 [Edhazardia aedis USNM 41457]